MIAELIDNGNLRLIGILPTNLILVREEIEKCASQPRHAFCTGRFIVYSDHYEVRFLEMETDYGKPIYAGKADLVRYYMDGTRFFSVLLTIIDKQLPGEIRLDPARFKRREKAPEPLGWVQIINHENFRAILTEERIAAIRADHKRIREILSRYVQLGPVMMDDRTDFYFDARKTAGYNGGIIFYNGRYNIHT
jgi:hypothetical protein